MKISLNGKPQLIADPLSIDGLISQLDLGKNRIAIELNQEIIPRSEHATTLLQEGDVVEVIHAIGGG